MDFLFDIGNVIVGVDFLPALRRLAPAEPNQSVRLIQQVLERKDEFEAGRIEADDYFPWAAKTLGYKGSQEDFISAWVDIFSPNPPMWDCIEQLHRAGHRLLLFSNTNQAHWNFLRAQYPVFARFSGAILSYETGHIKPEDEIYQLAINRYGLKPQATGYIDDLPANIGAGKAAGFICHQYHSGRHGEFSNWLASALETQP